VLERTRVLDIGNPALQHSGGRQHSGRDTGG